VEILFFDIFKKHLCCSNFNRERLINTYNYFVFIPEIGVKMDGLTGMLLHIMAGEEYLTTLSIKISILG
jgi:hypothetical protein